MNTKTLEKFAQNARRQLHEQVAASLERVLSTDSAELRAKAKTIATLEKEIQRASRQEVVERVAYTWFNRFCALRYMDVNHYTRAGTVSPTILPAGETYTQPEILQEAKQGHIGARLERFLDREMVLGLLDGSQPSSDPQQEAYRLLLVSVCNSYHEAMPFLFEPIDDYSELLMPEDLLSQGSILQGVRGALTPEQCQDVEVIGWLYQYYISEQKEEVDAAVKKGRKVAPNDLPAKTSLYTKHWVVRYLVENSLGRLWMLNSPNSRLTECMDYYVKSEERETDFLVVQSPEELRIADPAAGSGHMLTYAFDLLYYIYEEEGYNAVDIPRLILEKNLYGMEIDERAGALAAFALMIKGREKDRRFLRRGVQPNICVLKPVAFEGEELAREPWLKNLEEDLRERLLHDLHLFTEAATHGSLLRPKLRSKEIGEIREQVVGSGSEGQLNWLERARQQRVLRALDQAAFLARKHHVVVANPPYLGSRYMNASLKKFAKENYKLSKSDLFAMFIERGFGLTVKNGYNSMVTMESWMFLSSYKKLRDKLLKRSTVLAMVHMPYLGKGGTSMGINFGTAATVLKKNLHEYYRGHFNCVRYYETDEQDVPYEFPVRNERLATASAADFKKIPGSPIAYWVSKQIRRAFQQYPPLTETAPTKIGMRTGDNKRFLRLWFEVGSDKLGLRFGSAEEAQSSGRTWFPYNKGGSYRKWYGNNEYVVLWENDGYEIKKNTLENYPQLSWDNLGWKISNEQYYFLSAITWTFVSSAKFGVRVSDKGFLFDVGGSCAFPKEKDLHSVAAFLCSKLSFQMLEVMNPTLNFQVSNVGQLPFSTDLEDKRIVDEIAEHCVGYVRKDWDSYESSWDFTRLPLLRHALHCPTLSERYLKLRRRWQNTIQEVQYLEQQNNSIFIDAYGLNDVLEPNVPIEDITLTCNPHYRYGNSRFKKGDWITFQKEFHDASQELADISAESTPDVREEERLGLEQRLLADTMREFISYAVGCMFGRYSLDKPGLVLANQGETIEDYLRQVPEPTFMPDKDNVIPMLDGDWFPDDISERFKKFLRVTFGEENYKENLAFIEAAIGRDIRGYFLRDFYDHHLKMYSKRPIYWLFSSPNGSFNALIYMHRYRLDTVSVVLNDYLREFHTKLTARRRHLQQVSISGASSQRDKTQALKEMAGIDKVLNELREYEDEVLYPLATEQVAIDLDDGVAVNYGKFGKALKYVRGLS